MLLSAAILVFALSPDEARIYADGMSELRNFTVFCERERIKGYREYLDSVAVRRGRELGIGEALANALGPSSVNTSIYSYEDPIAGGKHGVKVLYTVQGILDENLTELTAGSLLTAAQHLTNHPKFYFFEPDINLLRQQILSRGFKTIVDSGFVLNDFRFNIIENGMEDQSSTVALFINGMCPYEATFHAKLDNRDTVLSGVVRGNHRLQRVKTISQWIETELTLAQDSSFVRNDVVFPALHRIWNDVKDLEPPKALFELQGKWEEKKAAQKLTVLEISFPQELIILGCPVISFFYVLFFLSTIGELKRRVKPSKKEMKPEHKEYWIGVGPGTLNKALLILTIAVLPIVAVIGLIIRLWNPYTLSFWTGAVFGAAGIAGYVLLYLRIANLRKNINAG